MPSNQERAAIIIGLCTIVAAIIGAYLFHSFPSLCGHPLQVKITDPHNGEKVVNWITVRNRIDE